MKNIFAAILFLSLTIGFGQIKAEQKPFKNTDSIKKYDHSPAGENSIDTDIEYSQIFNSVHEQASPPGGINEFRRNTAASIPLPEVTEKTIGKVIAKFVVWDDGSIRDIMIIKESPAGLGLGKEVAKILSKSSKWTPGKYNGRNVKQYFTLPILIEIDPKEKTSPTSEELKAKETPNSSKEKTIDSTDYSQIFNSVHVHAQPPGGMNAFRKKIGTSFNLPNVQEKTIGKVIAKFVVWDDGSIRDIQIIKETPENLGLGNEAIRILSSSDKWIPGVVNGIKVKQYFTLPIVMEMVPQMRMKQPMEEIKKD